MSNNINLYKNFLLEKISDTIPTLESVGDGSNLVNETKGPDLKIKSLKEGSGITLIETDEDITINTSGAGVGNVSGPVSSTINSVAYL